MSLKQFCMHVRKVRGYTSFQKIHFISYFIEEARRALLCYNNQCYDYGTLESARIHCTLQMSTIFWSRCPLPPGKTADEPPIRSAWRLFTSSRPSSTFPSRSRSTTRPHLPPTSKAQSKYAEAMPKSTSVHVFTFVQGDPGGQEENRSDVDEDSLQAEHWILRVSGSLRASAQTPHSSSTNSKVSLQKGLTLDQFHACGTFIKHVILSCREGTQSLTLTSTSRRSLSRAGWSTASTRSKPKSPTATLPSVASSSP